MKIAKMEFEKEGCFQIKNKKEITTSLLNLFALNA